MKKIGKNTKLYLIGMIIGGITLGITTVIADTIINSTSVAYKTTTVKAALDELYDIADFKEEVKDMLYPVGSIYISVSSTNPSEIFGGSWVKLSAGKFLQSTESEMELEKSVDAGLPNITGSTLFRTLGPYAILSDANGAFGANTTNTMMWSMAMGETQEKAIALNFDASRSSSVYGKSSTVQPPAIKVFMWKRTS